MNWSSFIQHITLPPQSILSVVGSFTLTNSLMNGDMAETVMTYDENGNMVSMENCNGESMSCTYYENGLIESVTDQNGNSIEYSYNNSGQITQASVKFYSEK